MTSAQYCQLMVERGRLVALFEGEVPVGYLTYLVCPTVEYTLSYYQRDLRLPPPLDYPDASVIYIEQLESLRFSRELLRQIRSLLTARHPKWTKAVWYRLHGTRWHRYNLTEGGAFYVADVQRPCSVPA